MPPLPTDAAQPPPTPSPAIHRHAGWRAAVLWPLATFVRLWGMTLRIELSPEDERLMRKRDEPVAFVLWHNRLFVASEIARRYRRGRPLYALVSASRDGAWLDAFFAATGLHTVRGSSSRLGREAATALVARLREGHDAGITPDGPKGPVYVVKPGALVVTRQARVPTILVGMRFHSAWRLRSWDGFYVPKPFSRIQVWTRLSPLTTGADDRDAEAAAMGERLRALNPDEPVSS